MIESLFWLSGGIVFYTYIGYPLLLAVLTATRKIRKQNRDEHFLDVGLLIAAHNEEDTIRQKLENSLRLNYPKNKLHIFVASDGSFDGTNEIVREFSAQGVTLLDRPECSGKTSIQNFAVQQTNQEIIVFSDANAMYDPDAILHLTRHFADPSVGCVCGELRYESNKGSVSGEQENLYWTYEKFIKKKENLFGSILGANGSIYAVRRQDYHVLPPSLISDFIEPLRIVQAGKNVVYESQAFSVEQSSHSYGTEFQRKKRIVLRSIHSLFASGGLLNLFKYPKLSFQLISHKVIRWLAPLLLVSLFVTNIFLIETPLFRLLLAGQVLFYVAAGVGFLFEQKQVKGLVWYAPFYFVLVNLAALSAIVAFLRGRNVVTWVPTRQPDAAYKERELTKP